MADLVNVQKAGEPNLQIERAALAQHVKLGWREFVPAPEPNNKVIDIRVEDKKKGDR